MDIRNEDEVQIEKSETEIEAPSTEHEESHGPSPRGAMAFVILMLIFYIGYWFLTWIEIFVIRGN